MIKYVLVIVTDFGAANITQFLLVVLIATSMAPFCFWWIVIVMSWNFMIFFRGILSMPLSWLDPGIDQLRGCHTCKFAYLWDLIDLILNIAGCSFVARFEFLCLGPDYFACMFGWTVEGKVSLLFAIHACSLRDPRGHGRGPFLFLV